MPWAAIKLQHPWGAGRPAGQALGRMSITTLLRKADITVFCMNSRLRNCPGFCSAWVGLLGKNTRIIRMTRKVNATFLRRLLSSEMCSEKGPNEKANRAATGGRLFYASGLRLCYDFLRNLLPGL